MRVALVASLLFVPAVTASQVIDSQVPQPVAPYVVGGACPFECCQLGDWTLGEKAALHATPSRKARVVGRLASGVKVIADTSVVILSRLGLVVLTRPYGTAGALPHYARGDSLIVLDYLGEGTTRVWWRGLLILEFVFWDKDANESAPAGVMLRKPVAAWWAHVRWSGVGRTRDGWLEASRYRVNGTDACSPDTQSGSGALSQGLAPTTDAPGAAVNSTAAARPDSPALSSLPGPTT